MKKFFIHVFLLLFVMFAGMVVYAYFNPVQQPGVILCDDSGPEFPLMENAAEVYGEGREIYVDSDTLTAAENQLIVLSEDGAENYLRVEIADTEEERALGLMHRYRLDEGAGMLFVFDTVKDTSFWMRNTHIALDMIWLDEKGRVTGVHENAVPESEELIPSNGAVKAVLELNAGAARALGMLGDGVRVIHPIFTEAEQAQDEDTPPQNDIKTPMDHTGEEDKSFTPTP